MRFALDPRFNLTSRSHLSPTPDWRPKHLTFSVLSDEPLCEFGLFCREINLLDGSFDNGIHFARESALAPIRALLPQEDRKALGALVVLYPSLSFANSEFTFSNNLRLNT